jgi:predicted nucleic acid-binding protein
VSLLHAAFVVDASVFVADARPPEPHHVDANRLLETLAVQRCVLHLPAIALAEMAAALARGTKDANLARAAVDLYRHWPGVRIRTVDERLAEIAAEIAAEYRLRGCDAVYVALAYVERAVLITLDGQQRERTPPILRALTPGQALVEWFQPPEGC